MSTAPPPEIPPVVTTSVSSSGDGENVTARVGSMIVEQRHHDGNITISTSHTPTNRIEVQGADVEDLLVAIDAVLIHRRTYPR